jgi:hypothetical protein
VALNWSRKLTSKRYPDDAWDEFIRENTSFASWKEMLEAAGAASMKEKLDLS